MKTSAKSTNSTSSNKTNKTIKTFFASSKKNSKYDPEIYGDFFLYNSSEDERELHELLDFSIKQSFDSSSNYED